MMGTVQTDLMKYSTHATPTAHERQALRIWRQARRAALSAVINRLLTQVSRFSVVVTRAHRRAQS